MYFLILSIGGAVMAAILIGILVGWYLFLKRENSK